MTEERQEEATPEPREAKRVRPVALVAKVIEDDFQVVLNRGSAQGVRRGDQYLIIHEMGQVRDPETGEDLGALRLTRGRGQITSVQEKFSILESIESKATSRSPREKSQVRLLGQIGFIANYQQEMMPAPFNKPMEGDIAEPI